MDGVWHEEADSDFPVTTATRCKRNRARERGETILATPQDQYEGLLLAYDEDGAAERRTRAWRRSSAMAARVSRCHGLERRRRLRYGRGEAAREQGLAIYWGLQRGAHAKSRADGATANSSGAESASVMNAR